MHRQTHSSFAAPRASSLNPEFLDIREFTDDRGRWIWIPAAAEKYELTNRQIYGRNQGGILNGLWPCLGDRSPMTCWRDVQGKRRRLKFRRRFVLESDLLAVLTCLGIAPAHTNRKPAGTKGRRIAEGKRKKATAKIVKQQRWQMQKRFQNPQPRVS